MRPVEIRLQQGRDMAADRNQELVYGATASTHPSTVFSGVALHTVEYEAHFVLPDGSRGDTYLRASDTVERPRPRADAKIEPGTSPSTARSGRDRLLARFARSSGA